MRMIAAVSPVSGGTLRVPGRTRRWKVCDPRTARVRTAGRHAGHTAPAARENLLVHGRCSGLPRAGTRARTARPRPSFR